MTDIIIIGAGVAGMTAALYARRNDKSVLILERENCGGQIANSPKVENIPSITAISGSDYADKIFDQITALGAQFELEEVQKIEKKGDIFTVHTDYGSHQSKTVIVAAGVKQRMTGVEGEEELIGRGVSYCALCDGAFYAGKEVVLIGDANTALQYALILSNYCKKVTILTLFEKFFAEEILVNAVRSRANIETHHNLSLKEFKTDANGLTGLVFNNKTDGTEFSINTEAVFIAIGHVPDNEKFAEWADLDKNGYFTANEDGKTKTAGFFVAGDCRAKGVRQLMTAESDGAIASTNACIYLDTLK